MAHHYEFPRRVSFADTDASGVAHFTSILKFVEEAEHSLMREMGAPVFSGRYAWPRVKCEAQYLIAMRFEDIVEVHLNVSSVRNSTVVWEFKIVSEDAPDEVSAKGAITTVYCKKDRDGLKPATIPRVLKDALSFYMV